jgi:hypothetical protein
MTVRDGSRSEIEAILLAGTIKGAQDSFSYSLTTDGAGTAALAALAADDAIVQTITGEIGFSPSNADAIDAYHAALAPKPSRIPFPEGEIDATIEELRVLLMVIEKDEQGTSDASVIDGEVAIAETDAINEVEVLNGDQVPTIDKSSVLSGELSAHGPAQKIQVLTGEWARVFEEFSYSEPSLTGKNTADPDQMTKLEKMIEAQGDVMGKMLVAEMAAKQSHDELYKSLLDGPSEDFVLDPIQMAREQFIRVQDFVANNMTGSQTLDDELVRQAKAVVDLAEALKTE